MVREGSVCVALAYAAIPLEAKWWHMRVALAMNLCIYSLKSYFGALGMLSFFSANRIIDIVKMEHRGVQPGPPGTLSTWIIEFSLNIWLCD